MTTRPLQHRAATAAPTAVPAALPADAAPALPHPTLPARVQPVQPVAADSEGRTGALRRLIGSLRRR